MRRKEIDATYRELLKDVKGIHCLQDAGETVANYSYFPILVDAEYPISRDDLYQKLKDHDILYTSVFLSTDLGFPDVLRAVIGTSEIVCRWQMSAAARVLCLPIYPALENRAISTICNLIGQANN